MIKKVLLIHPYDKSTSFLERIKNYLQNDLQEDLHYFSVKPNDESHKDCLKSIKSFSKNGLVLFMGHGKSNSLYGAEGDHYGSVAVSNEAQIEHPEKYYSNENFITLENINVFKGKKVICLTCNSNSRIGRDAAKQGAKVFLGFGDLPSSKEELEEKGEKSRSGVSLSKIEQALKTEINEIIKKCVLIGLKRDYTFSQLVSIINFMTNQKITFYLLDQKKLSERKIIANYLYSFKKGIKIYGDSNEKLFDN